MKKFTLILSILMILLSLTACGSAQKQAETVSDEPTAETGTLITLPKETSALITVPTEAAVPENDSTANYLHIAYAEQINRYYRALAEQWEEGRYYEEEMSPLASYYYDGNPMDNAGFAFVDLDHDSNQELVIGAIENSSLDPAVFEIWTLRNGIPTLLCRSGYRNRYYLEYTQEDNNWLIANVGSSSAANSAYHYYYLENGELNVAQAIVFDAIANESAPWFMAYDADWDTSNDTPIDEVTAISITEAHQASYTVPDYIPYSLY